MSDKSDSGRNLWARVVGVRRIEIELSQSLYDKLLGYCMKFDESTLSDGLTDALGHGLSSGNAKPVSGAEACDWCGVVSAPGALPRIGELCVHCKAMQARQ